MNLSKQLNRKTELFVRHLKQNGKSILKGKISYSDFLADKMLIVMAIRKGIPFDLFETIMRYSPFSLNDWAELLSVSKKSLQRYEQSKKSFKSLQSEKIIEMAEVTNLGLEVFDDMDKFKLWLETPNFALGNMKPFDLLRDSYGKEMVIGELTRVEHGIFS